MAKRDTSGHMEFEWGAKGPPVDYTSPFAHVQRHNTAPPTSPPKNTLPNSFAAAGKMRSPLKAQALSFGPQNSFFNPSLPKQPTGPMFRNPGFATASIPSFNTPQHRHLMDMSIDDSPAMTEPSPAQETPDYDRSDFMDSMDLSSPEPQRRLFIDDKRSGKGALARTSYLDPQKDRVRKRTRYDRDKDIGSTRSRLPGGLDEDDSDYDDYAQDGDRRKRPAKNMGWLHYILTTISANPDAPIVFSYYLQLFVDAVLAGLLLWGVWGAFTSARSEVIYAAEKAKAEKLAEIDLCSRNYLANKCAPLASRLPALGPACDEWETCMNQDPNSVAGVKASAGQMAEVINAFTAQLSWKSIIFLLMIVVTVFLANNMGFEKFRQNVRHYNHRPIPEPTPSHPAMGFPMSPEKTNQAYIFAPIGQTPKHIRRAFLQEDTDTDASPDQRLLPAPKTPSRRSPSKGERSRSPSKRIPSKGYY